MIQPHIHLPNEVFSDLQSNVKSSKHIAFSYSYLYFITYLYRYCEWYKDKKVTQADIKEKLQLSSIEKRVDYIIKQGGLLDSIGYTETTKDYPIEWIIEDGLLTFRTIEEHNKLYDLTTIITDRGYKVKYPVKGFYRTDDHEFLDGTFYEVENTHNILYSVFEKCMDNGELGCNAFYIYGYLKWMNDMIPQGYVLATRDVPEVLKMSVSTFMTYTSSLEEAGLIRVKRTDYKSGLKNNKANVYLTK